MPGDHAPALSLSGWVKGGPYDILDGNAIYVVEFWATWCPACRNAIAHVTELKQAYEGKGVVVLAVSEEDADTVSAFVDQQGDAMDYAVALDDHGASFRDYGIRTIPHVFVVDHDGVVVWRGHPADPELQETLDELTAP